MKTGALPAALNQIPNLWRGRLQSRRAPVLCTGHESLNQALPGSGWPLGALTEIHSTTTGSGEFSLLLPALAKATAGMQWAIMVDPPWIPYPPALHGRGVALERLLVIRTGSTAESLWACEQALRHLRGGVVMAWPEASGFTQLRRLQLAAAAGRKAAFLFRPDSGSETASPSALRLQLDSSDSDTLVTILKCRGHRRHAPVRIRHTRMPENRCVPRETPCVPTALPVATVPAIPQLAVEVH
jgi:hypothetical protein